MNWAHARVYENEIRRHSFVDECRGAGGGICLLRSILGQANGAGPRRGSGRTLGLAGAGQRARAIRADSVARGSVSAPVIASTHQSAGEDQCYQSRFFHTVSPLYRRAEFLQLELKGYFVITVVEDGAHKKHSAPKGLIEGKDLPCRQAHSLPQVALQYEFQTQRDT
jgi:hypothetical protein